MKHKPKKIVLASNNTGKLKEFERLFQPAHIEVVTQKSLGIDSAIEDGLSFVENAIIKARHASEHTGLPAIADDSGLEVDALNGAPGIYSSRYAGDHSSDHNNIDKVLSELAGVSEGNRLARFQCILVFMHHAKDPTPIICQGTWEGSILQAPQGGSGFGYDPIFGVQEKQCSAAELHSDEKNQLSHRGKAMRALIEAMTHQCLLSNSAL